MSSLKSELIKDIIVNFFSKYSAMFIKIILSMVLARLLSPEEYGIVVVVTVISSFVAIMGQIGMGPAIIQKDLGEEEVSSIFIFSIIVALFSSILFYNSGTLIGFVYNNDKYILISKLLSVAVFFNIAIMIPGAIIRKRKEFIKIGVIEFASVTISGIVAVILAFAGYSYFSLIYSSILSSVLMFIFKYYYSGISLYWQLRLNPVKKIFGYSFFQFLSNFFNYFSRNIDNLLIGKFMGDGVLGIYDKAYKLMRYPVTNLVYVITPVLHPVLAVYKKDEALIYSTYLKMIRAMAFVGIPLSVFVYFSSSEIILIMYGQTWIKAADILGIFAISLWVNMCIATYGPIFQSLGRTDMLFLANIVFSIFIILAVAIGLMLFNSLEGVAWLVTGAFYLIFMINNYLLIKKVLKESYLNFLKIFTRPLILSSTILINLYLITKIDFSGVFINLIIKSAVSLLTYVLMFMLLEKQSIIDLLKNLKGLKDEIKLV